MLQGSVSKKTKQKHTQKNPKTKKQMKKNLTNKTPQLLSLENKASVVEGDRKLLSSLCLWDL